MITKHLTEITTKFNPFTAGAKTCRIFLANLPPTARKDMKITAKILPKDSQEPSSLSVKFSESSYIAIRPKCRLGGLWTDILVN